MTDSITSERAASREPSASLKEQKADEASGSEAFNQPNTAETSQTANTTESDENNKDTTEDKTGDETDNKTQGIHEETTENKTQGKPEKATDYRDNSSMDGTKKSKADGGTDDEEEDDDNAENEAEYEVEMVVGHKHVKGKLHYHIKWNGYSSDDNSWEDKEDVFCTDLIEAYWKRQEDRAKSNGTTAAVKALKKDRDGDTMMEMAPAKRQKTSSTPKDAPKETPKVVRKSDEVGMNIDLSDIQWTPPQSWMSWEDKVETIHTVERINGQLLIRLVWKNGRETRHPIETAHEKFPQKLIQYYESHIKFSQA
ncbi:hypothetical protein BGW39_005759 [Mortierella sp. 14UC]|nr:hypothetical protein BGW39_005759 [Mortierella sp. 14UC]